MYLSDNEKRDIQKYIEAGKPLPDKYRFLLFGEKQEVELVWNGKTDEITNTVLPFQIIEQVDEPRSEAVAKLQSSLFDTGGRQIKGWTNKLIWGEEVMDRVTQKSKNIVGQSAIIHAKFEQIHPFSDGNGRIGRLLMNAMFLQANFAPAIIRQEQKRLYYTYLYKAQTKDDTSQLEDFLCEAVMEGFAILERKDR